MKNALIIIATILLSIPLYFIYYAAITAWMWLPFLMDHWSGIIIGLVISFSGEILYYKFLGDN